ncbi:Hypothetical_protein [Hexamita inflata]|uniref:Hypothetical_protein n=1 Tax=Hexamita inflata TaxID=28002 RepID=A0AA86QTG0_9EUKA|nr:Hypothetical protein HINF_LOCUS53376 [Hexamita inflata]
MSVLTENRWLLKFRLAIIVEFSMWNILFSKHFVLSVFALCIKLWQQFIGICLNIALVLKKILIDLILWCFQENLKYISKVKSRVFPTIQLQMVPKSIQMQLYLQQSIFAYLQNLVEIKYQQALHDVEIQLILYIYTKSILQQGKVDIFCPTLINIWSEKLQIKIKSVYVKAQKSQLQLGSFQERLLKNRGAHTVPYLVNFVFCNIKCQVFKQVDI